jgi:NAD(P)H-hydrate epimerase
VDRISCPLVIDADGLNLLAGEPSILKNRKPLSTILTPHPGEMGRLLGKATADVQKDRIAAAKQLAAETGAIVILKGYRTILANPAGNICINLTGGQALASAGTGDILTGIITGFLAQGLAPWHAAMAGVYIHGLIGNLFEAEFPQQGLNAMDILQYWNRAVHLTRTDENLEDEYLKIHFRL